MSFHASQITVPVGTNVRAFLVAMASFMALSLPGLAPRAQQPAAVGGAGQSSVEVDLSVLDEFGAAPAIPGLLMPETNRQFGEKIILKPPGRTSAAKPAVPAPRAAAAQLGLSRQAAEKPPEPPAERATSPRPKPPRAPPKPAIAAKSAPEAMPLPMTVPRQPVVREKAPPPPRLTPPPMTAPPPPPPPVAAAPSPAPAKAASPEPAPAKATLAAPKQAQKPAAVAAPAPKDWGKGSTLRIAFDGRSAKLPDEAKADLEALARALAKDASLRLQVKAYAAGTKDSANRARRLSLSRALSVRSYLIGKGLRSTRIDVRALGDKAESGPADRVDLLVVSR